MYTGKKMKARQSKYVIIHNTFSNDILPIIEYIFHIKNFEIADIFLNSSAIKHSLCRFSIRLSPIYYSFFRKALFSSLQVEWILQIINGIFSSKHTGNNQLASNVGHTFCCCQTKLITSFQHAV